MWYTVLYWAVWISYTEPQLMHAYLPICLSYFIFYFRKTILVRKTVFLARFFTTITENFNSLSLASPKYKKILRKMLKINPLLTQHKPSFTNGIILFEFNRISALPLCLHFVQKVCTDTFRTAIAMSVYVHNCSSDNPCCLNNT